MITVKNTTICTRNIINEKKKKNGQRLRKVSVADPLLAEKACIVEVNFTRATASCDAIFCRTTLALWFSSELEDAK